ncbi:MAG: hypothetical protein HC882_05395, partial [Acidobacteria bacterium]|nr:hypothetical protein [Acidobacteriota bacterium]
MCTQLSKEAATAIETAVAAAKSPSDALVVGSIAWASFVIRPEVRQIVLVDGPFVLGWECWAALDERLVFHSLREGVAKAIRAKELRFRGGPELRSRPVISQADSHLDEMFHRGGHRRKRQP